MAEVADWLAALGILAPAATGIAGYLLAGRNEEARDRRAAAAEVAARHATEEERLERWRHEFQFEVLLQLQEALRRQVRITSRLMFESRRLIRSGQSGAPISEEFSNEAYDAGATVGLLEARLLDDELRTKVREFHHRSSQAALSGLAVRELRDSEALEVIKNDLAALQDSYRTVMELLGELLRTELKRQRSTTWE